MPKINPFKIGAMLGRLSAKYDQPLQSFPAKTWIDEFLNAQNLELDCLEWVEDGFSDDLNPLFSREGRAQLASLQENYSISIDSICCHSFISGGLISSNKKVRQQWIERLLLMLQFAEDLGSKAIIIPLMEESSIGNPVAESVFLESMSNINVKDSSIKILLETDLSADNILNLLTKLNRDHFGIVYDLGNATQLQYNIYKDIEILCNVIGEIHLKDKDLINSYRLGFGETNFLLAAKAINDFEWKGRCILETPIFDSWKDEANHNVSFAKALISSIQIS